VLLHGIGSNAQSWSEVLKLSPAQQRWLAWNAPGYDRSQALAMSKPKALDYAQALWSWLDDLKVTAPITLAGHSLGALMAASVASFGVGPRRAFVITEKSTEKCTIC
jgi:pimeloyl-ACP methyl ester carboxylesterase